MTDDLKERLKVVARCYTDSAMRHFAYAFMEQDPDGDYVTYAAAKARITDLEARLAAAEAERDALVGAVKVLADHAKDRCADDAAWLDTDTVTVSGSIGDLRNSLAAYKARRKGK